MIHYHGLPITPDSVIPQAMHGAHFFPSFPTRSEIGAALSVCSSFAVDNGAFSLWKKGIKTDWSEYYEWVDSIQKMPTFDFAIIPDVIDGGEKDNDALIAQWPFSEGVPVWHLHESIERLQLLASGFSMVCFGSSGPYAKIGTAQWWNRMTEAFESICVDSLPITKVHGLRMLDPRIVRAFPFKSCDSTNVARNIGLDCRWTGSYAPPSKSARAAILRARIESSHSPDRLPKPDKKQELIELAHEA